MELRIKDVARDKGITQTTLAEKMNTSIYSVRKFYQSKAISTRTLERIANALGCEPWQLLVSNEDALRTIKKETPSNN